MMLIDLLEASLRSLIVDAVVRLLLITDFPSSIRIGVLIMDERWLSIHDFMFRVVIIAQLGK